MPKTPHTAVVPSPLPGGLRIGIVCSPSGVSSIDFLPADTPLVAPRGAVACEAAAALDRYFADPRSGLDVPLELRGTVFQQRVWAALRMIPAGEPLTYGGLAARLGSGPRAVAGACRANPVPLIVPCHRVVAANGGLGGYMGSGEDGLIIKRWLLDHESRR